MSVHARAPLRVDFAGGWTDVPEFAEREGGVVVAAAITIHVHVDFLLGGNRIRLVAEDLDERVTFASSGDIRYDGKLDLHKAALNLLPVTGGVEILSRSDAPSGSGLGASGALDVALVAGLARCRREDYEPAEVAELGFVLETVELGLLGGRQDQLSAALGGFHEFRFADTGPTVRRLAVDRDLAADLERHAVLVYTGHSHFSSGTHEHVWSAFRRGDRHVTDALHQIRDAAERAADQLVAADWRALADTIDTNWSQQQRLHATIATGRLRDIEAALRSAGAWGLKATGAGAGGCVLALCAPERRADLRAAAIGVKAEPIDFGFADTGVEVWDGDQDARADR